MCALLLSLALQAADVSPAAPPTSVDRVRAALERAAALAIDLPEPVAHFHVEVSERRLFTDLPPLLFGDEKRPAVPPWIATGVPATFNGTPPLAAVDLLALARYAASAISSARQTRAQRAAREEVARALREFCAAHDCRRADAAAGLPRP